MGQRRGGEPADGTPVCVAVVGSRIEAELIVGLEVDRGNHFAAWQEPDLFTSEVRAGFRSLRESPVPTPRAST